MTIPTVWSWTPSRYLLARHLAEGDSYREAGRKAGFAESTVKAYMYGVNEFRAYVDKITLENELATRAGTLRMLYRVVNEKLINAGSDSDTLLAYLKFIREEVKSEESVDRELTVIWKKAPAEGQNGH